MKQENFDKQKHGIFRKTFQFRKAEYFFLHLVFIIFLKLEILLDLYRTRNLIKY